MRRLLSAALLCTALNVPGQAQNAAVGRELESILTFEAAHNGTSPSGWGGGPPATIFVDGETVHGGRWSVRLERSAIEGQPFSTLARSIPIEFAGTTIEWRGFLRTENVSEFMGLWMRQDGDTPNLAFATMQPRQIKGTNDWTEYSISFPVNREAKQLYFGVLLAGTGKVWADDLRLLVDGKPVWEAPKADRPKTPLDSDHQFDAGSGIVISDLSVTQIQNLVTLGKTWGFLKYHHPAVTSGTRHWDYDLFRVLPAVLAAHDRQVAESAMRDSIRQLGTPQACEQCSAPKSDDLHFGPDIEWIDSGVGTELAGLLRAVHRGRSQGRQFYVSQVPNIGNPQFDRELAYAALTFPDAGYQLLSLYRFWNIIEYWFPYRDQLDEDWDKVLAEFIPRIALAKDKTAYQLEMIALIARVTDTHANLWSAPPELRPPAGTCQLPVITRFIENQAVVTGYSNATSGPATGLQIGDVIESLDGTAVPQLIRQWRPYYPASNEPTRLRDMARSLTRGACATARLVIRRPAGALEITAERQPFATLNMQAGSTHDLTGEAFRLLSGDVGYLKLSSVQSAQTTSYVERSKGTRGLIIDIRNYPSEFVPFALGTLLVDRPTPFARFTAADLNNPGAFVWRGAPLVLTPQQPHYAGKVVVLVDEVSQSQAEYTTMAFRAAPQTIVVGSTTAGADGNVSQIALPGGLRTMISGIGVFYPNKRPTQRIGIVPDVEAHPTIAGVRAGRDEVLEEGVRQILGRDLPPEQIQKMAAPSR
jgi:C-terminal processing protease CtpA/Prc